jgi:hypothetical protein
MQTSFGLCDDAIGITNDSWDLNKQGILEICATEKEAEERVSKYWNRLRNIDLKEIHQLKKLAQKRLFIIRKLNKKLKKLQSQ